MGFMKLFSKTVPPLVGLPSGCFTMDRAGKVVVGTVPSSFPAAIVQEIGRHVLETFREAQTTQLPLAELVVHYGSLKIVAREMRGGTMVFLTPVNIISPTKTTPTPSPL
jgi:hypothetical protein